MTLGGGALGGIKSVGGTLLNEISAFMNEISESSHDPSAT